MGYNNGSIENSYAKGDVTGANYVGGLAGYNLIGTISRSYALNSMITRSGGSNQNFGRIAGFIYQGTLSNNYANETMDSPFEDAFGDGDKDGADISLTDAQKRSTYKNNGWSIDDGNVNAIWDIDEDSSFPYLRWEK